MEASEVEKLIKAAFRGVTLGGGVSLRQTEILDNFGEGVTPKEFNALPNNEITDDWQSIPFEELEYCRMSHLDPKGFRYYIPAFIVSVLRQPKSDRSTPTDRLITTLHHLYPKRGDLWDHALDKYSILNDSQRSAIAHFLQELTGIIELSSTNETIIARALRNYWHSYLPIENSG